MLCVILYNGLAQHPRRAFAYWPLVTEHTHAASSARRHGLDRLLEVFQFRPGTVPVAFDAVEEAAEHQPEDAASQALGETGPHPGAEQALLGLTRLDRPRDSPPRW